MASPPLLDPVDGEKVTRARAFRRWIAAGAEPGGLRALAGEQTRGAQAPDERARVRHFAPAGGADESHLLPPDAVRSPPRP